jgi:hypothetical protein
MTEYAYRISCELTVTVDEAEFQRNSKEYFKYLLQYCLITGSKVNSKDFEVTRVTRVDRL